MKPLSYRIWKLAAFASVAGVASWSLFDWKQGLSVTIYGGIVMVALTVKAMNTEQKMLEDLERERDER